MRICRIATLLAAVIGVACQRAPAASSSTTTDVSADVAEIRTQSRAFDSTLSRADTAAFLALLADSVMWMVPAQPSLVGKAALQ